jgi:dihydroorotate dehydrogenase electron transfer subunit
MIKKVLQSNFKILANKKIGRDYFKLTFVSPEISAAACPGQFVEVRVPDCDGLLLRRPIGVHSVSSKSCNILVEIVGPATRALSHKAAGEYLDIIGPLGNGFSFQLSAIPAAGGSAFGGSFQPIIVAGGMGVAPLYFLAERIKQQKPLVLIGARTKSQILCEKEFKKLGCSVKIATDDGSLGLRGKVTDLLLRILSVNHPASRLATIYACGPKPMLKAVSRISQDHGIPAQISLEEHMSCGIGACLGCVVKTTTGFQRVCKEGPVFNSREIIWEGL